jgi:hypothetical protein
MGERARALGRCWRTTGEPALLALLVLIAAGGLALAAAELISWQRGLALLGAFGCLAALLLVPRMARLLRGERARLSVLGALAIAGLLAALGPGAAATQAEPLPAELAAALVAASAPARQDDGGAAQGGTLTFVAPPRIGRDTFIALLERGVGGAGPSPAAPYGGELYDIVVGYGIDPAVALAFFARESQFCTTGMCIGQDMKSWGHLRNAFKPARAAGYSYNDTGQFVKYASWQDSVADWCELILYGYVAKGLDTVDTAVPVYAPLGDGDNNPEQYIDSIYQLVAAWMGQPYIPRSQPHVYNTSLQEALLVETFLSNELEFHPNWGFHRYWVEAMGTDRPLGSPLGESLIVTVKGQRFAVQTFAMDTVYTPLAPDAEETNWNDVRRLSDLLIYGQP